MPRQSLNHTHTYAQDKGKKGYWMCLHPQCYHSTRAEVAKGKLSVCTQCGTNEFILDKDAMRRVKPRCVSCSTSKKALAAQNVTTFLDSIIPRLDGPSQPGQDKESQE